MEIHRSILSRYVARLGCALALAAPPAVSAQPAPVAAPAAPAVPTRPNTALIPVPQTPQDGGGINANVAQSFQTRHQSYVAVARKGGIDLLFVGDSITQGWPSTGKSVWDATYSPMKAAAFGVGYDRTQHVLWRLQNGEGEGFSPKVVELLIGTNNLGGRNTPDETVEGIKAVVQELRTRFPEARILLLGVLPRGGANDPVRKEVAHVNQAVSQLNDLDHIFYLDLGPKFLGPDGNILPGLMKSDLLHPAAPGYQVWADATKNILALLLNSPGTGK
jgi:lysophospholipase L1-like esterase